MSNTESLENELKSFIIESLSLEDISEDDIKSDTPLFGEELGLDSIDALELGVAIQKKYGINMQKDSEEDIRSHFSNIRSLALLISDHQENSGQ